MNFTEQTYSKLMASAAERFHFVRMSTDLLLNGEDIALWRHDIDISPHRALKLAIIEAELGVVANYYVQLSSRYYNLFEPEVCLLLRQISELGHEIGLHFDPSVLEQQVRADYESRIATEAKILGEILEVKVSSFTLHNPTTMVGVELDLAVHGGLINGSSSLILNQFEYCSDSNGIWRFRNLVDVIKDKEVKRLYALTHPEWWQQEELPPRLRIQRCINGRAKFCSDYYDTLLKDNGRPNIGEYR